MSLLRFYCDGITEPITELIGAEAHHLSCVRRLGAGDTVELFDGRGTLARGVIKAAGKKKVSLEIEDLQTFQRADHRQVIIATSIAKGERFDELVVKCTELGVDRIVPVLFERTVKKATNPKIMQRWESLVVSACKQCRRLFIPRIDMPISLTQAFEVLRADCPEGQMLVGGLEDDLPYLIEMSGVRSDAIAFVGPEGGVTEAERDFFASAGVKSVRLTVTTLRVETAALAFAAILTIRRDAQG